VFLLHPNNVVASVGCSVIRLVPLAVVLVACAGDSVVTSEPTAPVSNPPVVSGEAITVLSPNAPQAAMIGVPFRYDASRGGTVFSDPRKTGLAYTITFNGTANGLTATGGEISGTPIAAGIQVVVVTARDATGHTATQQFRIVVFGNDLVPPTLPVSLLGYSDGRVPLPRHFSQNAGGGAGSAIAADNTPATNAITDAGATLGRVLFYDRRLSRNDRVSCASCHQQQFAFSDTARLSRGFAGALTARHSMGLTNARFYTGGRFFWDERAASLEDQVLQPIQDATEMGLTLDDLQTKLSLTTYYPALFEAAFGSREITSDRVSRALAQFVRALVSVDAKIDRAFGPNGVPNFPGTFTAQELLGQQLYTGRAGCARCHGTTAHISDVTHNTGLDATVTDAGAGNGRFKAPSLRNVEVRAPYMHDGRFATLEQVVDFYDRGVQNNPGLDPRLRAGPGPNAPPLRLNLTREERDALVAFLKTFTDRTFLTDARLASPFAR
jgi:cytochrome c peroxidase